MIPIEAIVTTTANETAANKYFIDENGNVESNYKEEK